jgi:hypothetical protein
MQPHPHSGHSGSRFSLLFSTELLCIHEKFRSQLAVSSFIITSRAAPPSSSDYTDHFTIRNEAQPKQFLLLIWRYGRVGGEEDEPKVQHHLHPETITLLR